MEPGHVVATTYIRAMARPKGWAGYKANKGHELLFLYLGSQPRDGSNDLDVVERMRQMGWEMTPELKAELIANGTIEDDKDQ